jgi:hypothetical protein
MVIVEVTEKGGGGVVLASQLRAALGPPRVA